MATNQPFDPSLPSDSKSFCFYSPHFTCKSNGISLFWETAFEVAQLGHKVKIITFGSEELSTPLPDKFLPLLGTPFEDNDIVVYPDLIPDNPLNAKQVARFLLAKPYVLDGKSILYGRNDFVFSYSKAVLDTPPYLPILNPELLKLKEKFFRPKKNQVVLYFGKVRFGALKLSQLKPLITSFKTCRIVTRTTPQDSSQLYSLIAESELLISFDPLTNLCLEATLLETPVLVADPVFKPQYDNFNFKLHGYFYDPKNLIQAKNEVQKAQEELARHMAGQNEWIKKLIDQMTEHFEKGPNENHALFLQEITRESRLFYETKWNLHPIFNVMKYGYLMVYLVLGNYWNLFLKLRPFYRNSVKPLIYVFKRAGLSQHSKTKPAPTKPSSTHFPVCFSEKLCLYLIRQLG
jgi:hypothetical protein